MAENKQLTLPITGMTCANCVATVERSLKKEKGVAGASVNLSSERATVEFDPSLVGLDTCWDACGAPAMKSPPVKPTC
jgi:P-type Cu+ transporter